MKFYTYRQNNSGGEWIGPRYISIEAESEEAAEKRAPLVGIYFDGCDAGVDCPCCGDRWYRAAEESDEPPPRPGSPWGMYINTVPLLVFYADGRAVESAPTTPDERDADFAKVRERLASESERNKS